MRSKHFIFFLISLWLVMIVSNPIVASTQPLKTKEEILFKYCNILTTNTKELIAEDVGRLWATYEALTKGAVSIGGVDESWLKMAKTFKESFKIAEKYNLQQDREGIIGATKGVYGPNLAFGVCQWARFLKQGQVEKAHSYAQGTIYDNIFQARTVVRTDFFEDVLNQLESLARSKVKEQAQKLEILNDFEGGTAEGWKSRKVEEEGTAQGIGTWELVNSDKLGGSHLLQLDTTGGNANSNIALNSDFLIDMGHSFTLTFNYYLPESNNRGPFVIACREGAYNDRPISLDDLSVIFRIKHDPANGSPRVHQIDQNGEQPKFTIERPSFRQEHQVKIVKQDNTLTSYIDEMQVAKTNISLSGKWYLGLSGSGGWGSTRTIYFDNINLKVK